jgi:hypothetical protein
MQTDSERLSLIGDSTVVLECPESRVRDDPDKGCSHSRSEAGTARNPTKRLARITAITRSLRPSRSQWAETATGTKL